MNTMIQTNLLCDAISVSRLPRFRDRRVVEFDHPHVDSAPLEPVAKEILPTATPGYFLGTFTLTGSQVETRVADGELIVSFALNCGTPERVQYPARQIVASRIVGRCGNHDLIELTIAYSRGDR